MKQQLIIHDLPLSELASIYPNPSMKALLFDANPPLKHCLGCFNCWIKTPGRCIIADRGSNLPTLFASCQQVTIISRLVYGGFSPAIKAVLDRSIGYLLPYFRIVKDEMHHSMRYQNHFDLQVHFYDTSTDIESQKLATELVKANAINFGANSVNVTFYHQIEQLKEASL